MRNVLAPSRRCADFADRAGWAFARPRVHRCVGDLRSVPVSSQPRPSSVFCISQIRGRGVEVVALEPPHRHVLHAELLGGLEPGFAGDHLTAAAGDDGLLPAEATDAGGDVGDGRVVLARVRRGAEQPGDRDDLDRRRGGGGLGQADASWLRTLSRLEGVWDGWLVSK
jgi:hypothetical protein